MEHQSVAKSESDVQLMDCLDMFTVQETVDDNWLVIHYFCACKWFSNQKALSKMWRGYFSNKEEWGLDFARRTDAAPHEILKRQVT